ncbi:DUF192 domain-containing protein [Puniceicoccaceae bacterium K14]|nr:DUF192 domain-containing protein [Puniceicoccaceae bacterium K14]
MIPSIRSYIALFTLVFLVGCDKELVEKQGGLVEMSLGSSVLQVELALNRDSQARGLMHRDYLPEDQAMLFVFKETQQMSFWMRNTRIPLDIGYFTADGILREVYPLYPFDENARRSIRTDLLYALETNQGWFAKNGIKIGDKLDLSSLK